MFSVFAMLYGEFPQKKKPLFLGKVLDTAKAEPLAVDESYHVIGAIEGGRGGQLYVLRVEDRFSKSYLVWAGGRCVYRRP